MGTTRTVSSTPNLEIGDSISSIGGLVLLSAPDAVVLKWQRLGKKHQPDQRAKTCFLPFVFLSVAVFTAEDMQLRTQPHANETCLYTYKKPMWQTVRVLEERVIKTIPNLFDCLLYVNKSTRYVHRLYVVVYLTVYCWEVLCYSNHREPFHVPDNSLHYEVTTRYKTGNEATQPLCASLVLFTYNRLLDPDTLVSFSE